ncbi:hypothetical protein DEU56DRAFT_557244 [Suillus clintonianus]|uniref:uncharacterized protein n=1 Tax=Suillus clintonianus TaxID=1904413 RepID=UPI001B8605F7|nr:uncharacterized protein DEU56DRAFT_557244 [Suillus clintonianus]KAG2126025.1 hypothetical protein DEU56DRAFT_557244 [Suillus clintonianus]
MHVTSSLFAKVFFCAIQTHAACHSPVGFCRVIDAHVSLAHGGLKFCYSDTCVAKLLGINSSHMCVALTSERSDKCVAGTRPLGSRCSRFSSKHFN